MSGSLRFSLYQGDNNAAADDTADTERGHPVRKSIAKRHADKNRKHYIGIPKNGNNTRFVGAIGFRYKVLPEKSSQPQQ